MFDLSKYKNIHAIGIGGIGLSAICEILLSRGYNVSGSDMKESEMTMKLAQMGARVFIGHRKENVENADVCSTRLLSDRTTRNSSEPRKEEYLAFPELRCWGT